MFYIKQLFIFCFIFSSAYAQTLVTGKVSNPLGETIPGVNVVLQGTSNGTVTNIDGQYSIEVPADGTLIFSAIGFSTQEIAPGSLSILDVVLSEDIIGLEEVVVTALGVKREEKSLGYSVQSLSSKELAEVKATNPVNALSGKVSGVYVTGSSNGPTASANIVIRGAASLLGNNQPLFVVNGIPITNDMYGVNDGLNGSTTIDFGNAAQIVNTDDISSINVLKGPAASALFGSRAADGVILIETKTGKDVDTPFGVEINSSTTFEGILKLPDYQNEYGFGGFGKYSYNDGSTSKFVEEGDDKIFYYDSYGENWGPALNGQPVKQFNSEGEAVPFTPAENNIRDFFRTGITSINNISVSNSTETSDLRFSYTNLHNKGIVPNTGLKRNTLQMSMGKKIGNKIDARVNAMYVASGSDNVPNAGYDESSSIMYGWLWFPRQVEINDLKDYWQVPGEQQRYVENLWVNNPYFIVNENTNAFQSNRFITNAVVNYEINKNFSARFRYGADIMDEERAFRRAPSTRVVLRGSYREDEISFKETNVDFLIGYHTDTKNMSDFDVDVKIGANIMRQEGNYLIANNPELEQFGTSESTYTLTNARSGVLVESQKNRQGINSLFGLANFSYKNSVFLDLTYRNDWNSTLVNPNVGLLESNYSFGYPSAALSVIASDLLELPEYMNFFKFKGSYAEVGNGAPAYAFQNTFTPQAAFGSQTVFSTNGTIADPNLTNERTRAWEFGTDLRFFDGTVKLDVTYYNMLSFNQVIYLPVARASGYSNTLTNGGEISNKGLEISLAVRPVNTSKIKWDMTVNFGRNRAVVESLPDVIESGKYSIISDVFPGDEGGSDLEYVAEEGKLLGQLYGLGFERGPDGRIIHDNEKGLPILTSEKVSAGSYQPDFRLGVNNAITIGDLSISFLFDGQVGGKIYSRSHALYNTSGTITNNDDPNLNLSTLDGRPVYSVTYNEEGKPVYKEESKGGVTGPGWNWTDTNGDEVIDINNELTENEVEAKPTGYSGYFYTYYGNGFNRDNIEAATYNATYFKLRELSIGYNIPSSWLDNIGISRARISLIGRNLLLFSKVPTIDPETYSIRNGTFVNGFESTQLPSTRSYGFNINIGI